MTGVPVGPVGVVVGSHTKALLNLYRVFTSEEEC